MNLDAIRELARIMGEHKLVKLEITEDNIHISLESQPVGASAASSAAAAIPQAPALPAQGGGSGLHELKSPLVGTLYLSSESSAAPFVSEGQGVKKGDTLCMIESMKMLNDIPADIDGTVSKIRIKSGQMVEFDQPLFLIEPNEKE